SHNVLLTGLLYHIFKTMYRIFTFHSGFSHLPNRLFPWYFHCIFLIVPINLFSKTLDNSENLLYNTTYADMAELADAPDLGSGVPDVQVQVLLSALNQFPKPL